jgi:hypothetical protein
MMYWQSHEQNHHGQWHLARDHSTRSQNKLPSCRTDRLHDDRFPQKVTYLNGSVDSAYYQGSAEIQWNYFASIKPGACSLLFLDFVLLQPSNSKI